MPLIGCERVCPAPYREDIGLRAADVEVGPGLAPIDQQGVMAFHPLIAVFVHQPASRVAVLREAVDSHPSFDGELRRIEFGPVGKLQMVLARRQKAGADLSRAKLEFAVRGGLQLVEESRGATGLDGYFTKRTAEGIGGRIRGQPILQPFQDIGAEAGQRRLGRARCRGGEVAGKVVFPAGHQRGIGLSNRGGQAIGLLGETLVVRRDNGQLLRG